MVDKAVEVLPPWPMDGEEHCCNTMCTGEPGLVVFLARALWLLSPNIHLKLTATFDLNQEPAVWPW
jgi:hypothetical protein